MLSKDSEKIYILLFPKETVKQDQVEKEISEAFPNNQFEEHPIVVLWETPLREKVDPKQPFVSDEILSEAAFLLLSSSNLNRYMWVAKEMARQASLRERWEKNEFSYSDFIYRSMNLWKQVRENVDERDEAEIELALILVTIARIKNIQNENILKWIISEEIPTTYYICALAKKILQEQKESSN